MPHSVKAVANRFLDLAERDGREVGPLQMQKLAYLAQGWALGLTGEPLFGESLEAWNYGPVVPSLYHSLKLYGSSPIRARLLEYDFRIMGGAAATAEFSQDEEAIMAAVWDRYGTISGSGLIRLTHEEGAPWDVTRRENPGQNDARIPSELLRAWFEQKADEASRINSDAAS